MATRFGQPDFVASLWGTAGDEARTRDVLLGKKAVCRGKCHTFIVTFVTLELC
jgi:hypothetical protein